jgi:hypothetical protein
MTAAVCSVQVAAAGQELRQKVEGLEAQVGLWRGRAHEAADNAIAARARVEELSALPFIPEVCAASCLPARDCPSAACVHVDAPSPACMRLDRTCLRDGHKSPAFTRCAAEHMVERKPWHALMLLIMVCCLVTLLVVSGTHVINSTEHHRCDRAAAHDCMGLRQVSWCSA